MFFDVLCASDKIPRFEQIVNFNFMKNYYKKETERCIAEVMHLSVVLYFYLLMQSKRAMMAAICSRVVLFCGWKVPSG